MASPGPSGEGKMGEMNRSFGFIIIVRNPILPSINRIEPLGREIKISPKSAATVNDAGHELKFLVPTVSVLIGIGKDETADLVMTEDAWNALNNGEKLNIETVKSFKALIGVK